MWRVYLLEFVCVAILSIIWVILLSKEKKENDKNKQDKKQSQ